MYNIFIKLCVIKKPVIQSTLVRLILSFALLTTTPLGALEIGLSVFGGGGLWAGEWEKSVETFSEDFSQSTTSIFLPVASMYLDASFSSLRPMRLSVALGAGSWGGRLLSSGGSSPDRISSITCIGLDLVPSAGLRFNTGKAEFGADLRLGLGLLVSPIWTTVAWPDVTTTTVYQPSLADLGYVYTGASISYGFPFGKYDFSVFLSGDVGIAKFDASSGTRESLLLKRAGIGLRLSYDLLRQRKSSR